MADHGPTGIKRWDQGLRSTQTINGQEQLRNTRVRPKSYNQQIQIIVPPWRDSGSSELANGDRINRIINTIKSAIKGFLQRF
jgi:hypothetical protein